MKTKIITILFSIIAVIMGLFIVSYVMTVTDFHKPYPDKNIEVGVVWYDTRWEGE